jgi:hypothetical protein
MRTGHNPPRRASAGWWLLTTTNAAGINGLTCFPKHGGARDKTFLVTHPMTDQRCLISAIARRSALTAGPSSSSNKMISICYQNNGSEKLLECLSPVTVSNLVRPGLHQCGDERRSPKRRRGEKSKAETRDTLPISTGAEWSRDV